MIQELEKNYGTIEKSLQFNMFGKKLKITILC